MTQSRRRKNVHEELEREQHDGVKKKELQILNMYMGFGRIWVMNWGKLTQKEKKKETNIKTFESG